MVGRALDIDKHFTQDQLAAFVADKWHLWDMNMAGKLKEWKELRDYVYATDTTTTSSAATPWSHTTHIPVLGQIHDRLTANYMTALFPGRNWMDWQANDEESEKKDKVDLVKSYMSSKIEEDNFHQDIEACLDDYSLYGNVYGEVEFVNEYEFKEDTGEAIEKYVGPRLRRISPLDIRFNPAVSDFVKAPKIVRKIMTLGDVAQVIEDHVDKAYMGELLDRLYEVRHAIPDQSYTQKNQAYIADGFGSIEEYYASDFVEILTFYGDIYDKDTKTLRRNRVIEVADRRWVLSDKQNPSWSGYANIFHVNWRQRPDNLIGMGPLDNLVGLQYKVNHLENARADAFDQIVYPRLTIRGDIDDFEDKPGEHIYLGDEGAVGYLAPDTTALNADFQIANTIQMMEEIAGAPKESVGFRTPGEKTALEFASLEANANKIFKVKAERFEKRFLEPVLNAMLSEAARNLTGVASIVVSDEETGANLFVKVNRSDLVSTGKIHARGARHFNESAARTSNLQQMFGLLSNPATSPHVSGKGLVKLVSDEIKEPQLYGENIAMSELKETELAKMEAQAGVQEELAIAEEMGT